MFYSQFILAKKGPLGTIWIAAHLERKLRKNQVSDTDIGVSVDSILFPEMPIALRLSSHLLLGVVRIYSRKVNYLFDDCSEALLKVKQAFRSTAVDLPPEESTAPYHSITLPETFDLDDFELPDSEIFQGNYVDHHISSKDQITLQDTMDGVVYSTSKFGLDEIFGDGDTAGLDLDEELLAQKAASAEHTTGTSNSDVDPQASVHANASFKYGDNRDALTVHNVTPASGIVNQHIEEEYDGDNEPAEYAQAPCTPGLWEEPNLSNIQETSTCDDHQEPENHNITESAVNENLENASHEHHNLFESLEKSPPHIAATEHMLMDDLGSSPFSGSLLPESESVIAMSDDPAKLEDLLNKNAKDKEPGVPIVDGNHRNFEENQGMLNNMTLNAAGNQEHAFHHATELESNTEPIFEPKDSTIPVQFPHDSMPNSVFPSRPFVTLLNHETNGEGAHATEGLDMNSPQVQLAEAGWNDKIREDNIHSYTSDYPAPEKLLSLPQGLSDLPKDVIPESTPAEQDDILSGKKRSFTESSLTDQSLNLVESPGLFTSNITGKSVMDDDDLLSSILVGRKSSILKMKPTPMAEKPSTKRRLSATKTPKTGVSKRKVVMDDNMVLHGDTIRQQLINTEDIRRLRKKAPCTRTEISMLEKQFWEDELFSESIFTGVSIKLASLHSQLYDLSKIVVTHSDASLEGPKSISRNDEMDMRLEVGLNVPKEKSGDDNFGLIVMKNVSGTQSNVFPLATDNHTYDNATNFDYNGTQAHMQAGHDLVGQGMAMDIDARSFSDAVPEVESLTYVNMVRSDTYDMSTPLGEVENTIQIDASLQTDAPGVLLNKNMDSQFADMDNFMDTSIESNIPSEIKFDGAPVTELAEEKHDQDIDIRNNEEEVVNEDTAFAQNVESNAHNLLYNGIFGEDFATVGTYDAEVNPVLEDVPLYERENPGHQVTFQTNVEDIPDSHRVDDDELAYSAVGNNTDFLNFDDVDDDDAGDYAPDVEATRVIDNSGWSSRTKAVAKYLQIMFDKEGERGRNMIPVNNLLIGKTRKEASRMFFETLVLKTKDYIHVEQADPYDNINVFPRAKLLKSDF